MLRAPANEQAGAGGAQGAGEGADVYRITRVFLHIRSEADRDEAQRLAESLQREGFRVPGIELVAEPRGYGANVRYYYGPQEAQAGAITQRVLGAAASAGLSQWGEWRPNLVSLAGRYDRLPRNQIEVWLPPLR
ncbi:MAG: hypothetical protein AB7O04_11705, partial [Hyphomonadaceae bacterium]